MTEAGFVVVIPARYAASRLPGKPLRKLGGRPIVQHVWDRALATGAREVIVATDDERVFAAVESFGGKAMMTASDHLSGTDRIAEVAKERGWSDDVIVVNLQGDEPGMDADLVRAVVGALQSHPDSQMATFATPIRDTREMFDENVVKVVINDAGVAQLFSRAPIPWVRGEFSKSIDAVRLPADVEFLRHLGLYAYRVSALRTLCAAPPSTLERAESLEQLRALALGMTIHVSIASTSPSCGIDTEEDLARAERALLEGTL